MFPFFIVNIGEINRHAEGRNNCRMEKRICKSLVDRSSTSDSTRREAHGSEDARIQPKSKSFSFFSIHLKCRAAIGGVWGVQNKIITVTTTRAQTVTNDYSRQLTSLDFHLSSREKYCLRGNVPRISQIREFLQKKEIYSGFEEKSISLKCGRKGIIQGNRPKEY